MAEGAEGSSSFGVQGVKQASRSAFHPKGCREGLRQVGALGPEKSRHITTFPIRVARMCLGLLVQPGHLTVLMLVILGVMKKRVLIQRQKSWACKLLSQLLLPGGLQGQDRLFNRCED